MLIIVNEYIASSPPVNLDKPPRKAYNSRRQSNCLSHIRLGLFSPNGYHNLIDYGTGIHFTLQVSVRFVESGRRIPGVFLLISLMSKSKSSEVPHYELLCLFSNKFSETEVEPIKERVGKLINDYGGTITSQEYWGKRKLAYQVDGFRHGYYHLIEFNIDGPKLIEVSNRLRLSNDILRHQIVKKHLKTAAELKKEAEVAVKIAARKKAEAPAAEESADDNRAELKDLDQKLDKIIDASNLL